MYDPALGRFHTLDPLAECFPRQSPFVYADNNPVRFIDFMGLSAWIPDVDDDGQPIYIPEEGDSAETLSSQFGIDLSDAERITGTEGDDPVDGDAMTDGDRVKSVLGYSILRLNLMSKEANSQRIFNQYLFGMKYSVANPTEFTPKREIQNICVRASAFFSDRKQQIALVELQGISLAKRTTKEWR